MNDKKQSNNLKEKINEFIENNPNLKEKMEVAIDKYGTIVHHDEFGRIIFLKDIEGYEKKWVYGQFGITFYSDTKTGFEERKTYNDKGLKIAEENSDGVSLKFEYDEKNNLIKLVDNQNNNVFTYEYDNQNRLIYEQKNNEYIIKIEYFAFQKKIVYIYYSNKDGVDVNFIDTFSNFKEYKIESDGKQLWFEGGEKIKELDTPVLEKNKIKKVKKER